MIKVHYWTVEPTIDDDINEAFEHWCVPTKDIERVVLRCSIESYRSGYEGPYHTYDPRVVECIQALVYEGVLKPSHIELYWNNNPKRLELLPNGDIVEYPHGFFEESSNFLNRLIQRKDW